MYNVICCGGSQAEMILIEKKYDIDLCLNIFKKYCRYKWISYGGDDNIKIITNSTFNNDDWDILSKLYNDRITYLNNHHCMRPIHYWYCERYDKEKQERFILGLDQKEIDLLFSYWDNNAFIDSVAQLAKGKITEIINNKLIKDIIE